MADAQLIDYAKKFCLDSSGRYRFARTCGAGNSASVFEIHSANGPFALKVYDPRFFLGENAVVEKRRIEDQLTLRGHDHPNLIKLFDAGIILDSYFLLMEFLPWRPLNETLNAIAPDQIWNLIEGIASAARFLEEKGFVHRDIKPANIMASEDRLQVKLLDLGVLRSISHFEAGGTDQGPKKPFVATAQYSSPEYLFRIAEASPELWRGLTYYQLGGVLHDLIMQKPLFEEEVNAGNKYHLAYAVLKKTPVISNQNVDARLIALARNSLHKDLKQRLERVGWDQFNRPGTGFLSDARKRLRLGDTKVFASRAGDQEIDRLRLNATKIAQIIADWVRDTLLNEGFPRHALTITNVNERTRAIWITFLPVHASDEDTKLECLLEVGLQVSTGNEIEIQAGFALTRSGSRYGAKAAGEPLWTTDTVQLESDSAAFIDRFLAVMITAYDRADQMVPEFEASRDQIAQAITIS